MYKGKRILGIIAARGDSKRLPGKNIKELCGKPLVAWTIEAGLKSKYIDRLITSTDGKEIAETAKKYGSDVPFMRPAELASDTANPVLALIHAVDTLEAEGDKYDILVLLQPTSPLRDSEDIDNVIRKLVDTEGAESCVCVARSEEAHPAFLVRLEGEWLRPYINKDMKAFRRQDIDDLYYFEGSGYASYVRSIKKRMTFFHERTVGNLMPKWKTFEIDDLCDHIVVEALLKAKIEGVFKKEDE